MFKHGKTDKVYYSIREKKKHYKRRIYDPSLSSAQRAYAQMRFTELEELDSRRFDTPAYVVTDDRHFGNSISKPRLCVAYKTTDNGRVRVAPLYSNKRGYVSLGSRGERYISDIDNQYVDLSDIYEAKYITEKDGSLPELSERDIVHIQYVLQRKKQ